MTEKTNLISTGRDAQRQVSLFYHLLPLLLKVEILTDAPAAEEEEILCEDERASSSAQGKARDGKAHPWLLLVVAPPSAREKEQLQSPGRP